jgi:hypothetical protein
MAHVALLLLLAPVVVDALQMDTIVMKKVGSRFRPLFGFGTEFVFQTFNNSGLNKALVAAQTEIGRFPGGTPSDYWLWSEGWVNTTSDRSGCSNLPRRTTTPNNLSYYLQETNQTSVLVLNQLQTNLSYQMDGVRAFMSAGFDVKYLELGNEMYDSTRPDVLATYPEPRDYAIKMAQWTTALKKEFPSALVALVGLANDWDNRTRVWNDQVLNNPLSSQADAATVHLYAGIPGGQPSPSTYGAVLALLFEYYTNYAAYIDRTIPSRFRIWVTEWGTFGNTAIFNTWLQGLWHGAFSALLPSIPRIDILLPYCAICGDPSMPSFTSQYGPVVPPNITDANWTRTASGHVYAQLFAVAAQGSRLAGAVFSPNPRLDPTIDSSVQLVGVVAENDASLSVAALALNLGSTALAIDVSPLAISCLAPASLVYSSYYPRSLADVVLQNIAVESLGYIHAPVGAGPVSLAPYSVTSIVCE